MIGHLSDEQLDDFVDDVLAPEDRRVYAAHLAQCDECSQRAHRTRALIDTARRLPPPEVPGYVWPMVAVRTAYRDRFQRGPTPSRVQIIAAVAIALAVGALAAGSIARSAFNREADAAIQAGVARALATWVPLPSLDAIPAPAGADSAFYRLRERTLRAELTPGGRMVLAAAESLAVFDRSIEQARSAGDARRVGALLDARYFYILGVLRAVGENVDHILDHELRR